MDTNTIFFTRTSAAKKVEIAKALTEKELLATTTDTIKRMVIEAGKKDQYSKTWSKSLGIWNVGNDWNSTIERVTVYLKKMTVEFYIQYENTDTSTSEDLPKFLGRGDYNGSILRDDRRGNPRTYYFSYSQRQKAEFVRGVILSYLKLKYAEKN